VNEPHHEALAAPQNRPGRLTVFVLLGSLLAFAPLVLYLVLTGLSLDVARSYPWFMVLYAVILILVLIPLRKEAKQSADLQQRVTQLDALRKIGEAVDLRQELDTLLALIYRQTDRIMEMDNYYVALYDTMRQEFRMAFYIEEGEERVPSNLTWSLGTGLTSQIIQTGEPIVTDDYIGECVRRGVPTTGKPARAWLGVPLVSGPEGEVLGVLNVSSFQRETVYSQEQVDLMRTLAD
jgi:transcriptional regulator with GAF, ATPase, and Fis domain